MKRQISDQGRRGEFFLGPQRRELLLVGALVVAVGVILVAASTSNVVPVLTMWFAGAAGLGLLTGFITGASEKEGTAAELMGFISSGIVVPLLGAIAVLLQQTQTTTETSSYTGDQLTQKVTAVTTLSPAANEFLPLYVAGGFFFVYGIMAVVGVGFGVYRRNSLINTKPGGIKLKGP